MADKIVIGTSKLSAALSIVEKSLPKGNTPIPALKNILFQLSSSGLSLTTTDLAVMSKAFIPFGVPFEIDIIDVLVDADKMIRFINSLDKDSEVTVRFDTSKGKLVLRSSGRTSTLNTMNSNEFAMTDFTKPSTKIDVSPALFSTIAKSVAGYHLPANDDTLSVMRGIQVVVGNNGIRASATDNIVGASCQFGDVDYENNGRVIVIGDQLVNIARVLDKCDALSFYSPGDDEKKLFISGMIEDVYIEIVIQILAFSNYPNMMEHFLNTVTDSTPRIFVAKEDVQKALKPMVAYDTEIIQIDISKENLHFSISDDEVSVYEANVECTSGNLPGNFSVLLNRNYLKSAIDNISTEQVEIATSDEMRLVVLIDTDEAEGRTYYQGMGKMAAP